MSEGGQQAVAGWYPDPHQPARLRYWDGNEWTEHYHQGDGKLPDIGKWLSSTFSAIGAYGIPALGLAFGASLVLNLITALGLSWAVGDLAIINEELVGDVTPPIVRAGVMILIVTLIQGVVWMAINRFMQRAHLHAEPSIGEAIQRAIIRLPRMIGVYLLLAVGFGVIFGVFVAVVFMGSGSPGVVILLFFALMPFMVWAGVKVSFVSAAVVAAPSSENAIKASASVSKGRWWGVFGRILLLSLMVGLVSGALSGALGGLGSPIDQDALNDIIVGTGNNISVRNFRFDEFLPDTGSLIPYLLISSVLNALTGLVTTSGFMRLYLDSGAPSEI